MCNEDGDAILSGAGKLDHVMEAWQAELTACIQWANAAMHSGMGRLSKLMQ